MKSQQMMFLMVMKEVAKIVKEELSTLQYTSYEQLLRLLQNNNFVLNIVSFILE